jgi:hypothetical protein
MEALREIRQDFGNQFASPAVWPDQLRHKDPFRICVVCHHRPPLSRYQPAYLRPRVSIRQSQVSAVRA